MPNIIFNIPLYFTGITIYIYTIYTHAHGKRLLQLSRQSVMVQRSRVAGSIPSRRPWSCIFRNWSRLGLEMYIFPTLEFTLLKKIYLQNKYSCLLIFSISPSLISTQQIQALKIGVINILIILRTIYGHINQLFLVVHIFTNTLASVSIQTISRELVKFIF